MRRARLGEAESTTAQIGDEVPNLRCGSQFWLGGLRRLRTPVAQTLQAHEHTITPNTTLYCRVAERPANPGEGSVNIAHQRRNLQGRVVIGNIQKTDHVRSPEQTSGCVR